MTETRSAAVGLNKDTSQISSNLPQNVVLSSDPQSIVSQPVSSFHEIPEMDQDEELEKEKRRNDDCCCASYDVDDDDAFFLFRCIAWCCIGIGKCTENCCDGCAECIHDCCESSGNDNSGDVSPSGVGDSWCGDDDGCCDGSDGCCLND